MSSGPMTDSEWLCDLADFIDEEPDPEIYDGSITLDEEDSARLRTIAARLSAEDDDTPVDPAWVESVGGYWQPVHGGDADLRLGGEIWFGHFGASEFYGVCGDGNHCHLKTRGRVRLACRLLEIELRGE